MQCHRQTGTVFVLPLQWPPRQVSHLCSKLVSLSYSHSLNFSIFYKTINMPIVSNDDFLNKIHETAAAPSPLTSLILQHTNTLNYECRHIDENDNGNASIASEATDCREDDLETLNIQVQLGHIAIRSITISECKQRIILWDWHIEGLEVFVMNFES